jgi:pyrroline-5-carboxylate reductase
LYYFYGSIWIWRQIKDFKLLTLKSGKEQVMEIHKIAVVGGGNMGQALLKGLFSCGYDPQNVLPVEVSSSKRKEIKEAFGMDTAEKIPESIGECQAVVIAVKPGDVSMVFKELSPHLKDNQIIISVAAGISLEFMKSTLPEELPLVRAMPNIAARVGKAAVAICFNEKVSEKQKKTARKVMESIGTVIEIDEKLMDAVTGLSGSGPAFVFMMIEALAEGGVLMGLPREKALQLAVLTVHGAADYLLETQQHPSVAKEMVASPGGTTVEGILQLEEGGFRGLIMQAVKRAAEKARSLGSKPVR